MEREAAQSQSQRRSTLRSRPTTIRKPFSDCTNNYIISLSQPNPDPAADPSTPLPHPWTGGDENVLEIRTHKQTADKGNGKEKIQAAHFHGYYVDRVVNAGNKRKKHGYLGLLEPHTVPLKKINFDGNVERRELAVMEGETSHSHRRSTLRSSNSSRSRTNRKPFSDCTNTIFQSQSQSSPATVVAVSPKPKPYFQPKIQSNLAATTNSIDPSTPVPPSRPSPPCGDDNDDGFEIHTVYTRRQTADARKGKEKALPVSFSSYSADRILSAGNRKNENEDMGLLHPHTVPLKKQQQHGQLGQDASEQDMQDYIQQQRAYFDEVDAFELPEEEVGSGNNSE